MSRPDGGRGRPRSDRVGPAVIAVVTAAALLAACTAREPTSGTPGEPLPPTPFLVSNPGAGPGPVGQNGAASAPATVAWVSLSPGKMPGATSVTIRVLRTGARAFATMIDGGFDPVSIPAQVRDTLEMTVQNAPAGQPSTYLAIVPVSSSPHVVRADPPRHQHDVPVNAVIAVTFSEPMDSFGLAGSISLTTGETEVPGRVVLPPPDSGLLHATFVPAGTLALSATYRIEVNTAARDRDGDALETAVSSDFVTSSTGPVADTAGPVPVILGPPAGDSLAVDYLTLELLVQNSSPVAVELFLDDADVTGIPGSEIALSTFGGRWPSDTPLDVRWYTHFTQPGAQHIHVGVRDSLGRYGRTAPIPYTLVVPDSQPRAVIRDFSVLELGGGSWFYAPQLLLADSAGGTGFQIVGFEMLDIPGLTPPFPRLWAIGLSVPPDQDVQVFAESYGDWPVEYYASDGRRTVGTTARARLTYRDLAGRFHATTVEGPIVPGALPTTYSGSCTGWSAVHIGVHRPSPCSTTPARIAVP